MGQLGGTAGEGQGWSWFRVGWKERGKETSVLVWGSCGAWWLNSGFLGGKLRSGSDRVPVQVPASVAIVDSYEDQLYLVGVGNGGLITVSGFALSFAVH